MKSYLPLLLMLLCNNPVHADIVLMVHGYLGDSSSWERSQVSQILDRNELEHRGRFVAGARGPQLLVPTGVSRDSGSHKSYLAELPSLMPVNYQSDMLQNMIVQLRTIHPDEDITLVGHSAGGLIARLTLVRYGTRNINSLITIASPHLGTSRAGQALDVTANHGPFNMVKSFFGGNTYDALVDSRALLIELVDTRPGSMLYWLNHQPHPDIEYVSIIRTHPNGAPGDDIVPGYSQNMNNVPALHSKSDVIMTSLPHSLTPHDGVLLLELLRPDDTTN